jgi:DNA-binding NarL/FixJ family response regulator
LATLNALGAHRSADKARARLRDLAGTTSTTPRPSTRQHPFALTRRQAEVLDLIAGGLTDRQIAERLYLSPRTVGKHVAAILVKLGVGDRRSAAHLRATTPDSAAPGESTG